MMEDLRRLEELVFQNQKILDCLTVEVWHIRRELRTILNELGVVIKDVTPTYERPISIQVSP